MLAYCTYCSAEKIESKTLLPAIERYKSVRIATVFAESKKEGLKFIILSGKYGLVEAEQKIENYDHLLLISEVEKLSTQVSLQLIEKKISKIIFFTNLIEHDKKLQAYMDCISLAAIKGRISLEVKELSFND